jgi:type II secretory pathway pseudopilin PulG
MMSWATANSQRGFSLVDTLMGTLLLAITLVAFMAGFAYVSRGTSGNTARVQALSIAQEVLEDLKKNDGLTAGLQNFAVTSPVERNGISYGVLLTSPTVNALTGVSANLQPRQVTVSWQEGSSTKSLSMVTYYYMQ